MSSHWESSIATGQHSKDAELAQVLEHYLAQVEAGDAPDVDCLVAEHPAIAARLQECLMSLQLIENATSFLGESSPLDELDGAGRELGDFRLLREIGRGGMGVVYEAEQLSLGRSVAVKVLPFASMLDQRQLSRFKNEARAAASLRHPHIVGVHSVGCERGVHYYAMELIEGRPLSQVITQIRGEVEHERPGKNVEFDNDKLGINDTETQPIALLSTQYSQKNQTYFHSITRLVTQAAEALQYAHEEGIVHRDIKPSNLLLDGRGKIWISDFGLAQIVGDHNVTMTGDLVGTLRYMSPEQADGKKLLDHRTDIYSLGITLYELLTLRPAFDGRNRHELLRQLENEQLVLPRARDAAIPADLETIVLKSTARAAEDRYDSAADLADDLKRFLDHRPIHAKRMTRSRQIAYWIRRHRLVASLSAALTIVLTALAIGGPIVAMNYARIAQSEMKARNLAGQTIQDLRQLLTQSAANTLVALEDSPASTPVKRKLANDMIYHCQCLLARSDDSDQLHFQIARVYRRIAGIIELEMELSKASQINEQAIDLLEKLVRRDRSNSDYRFELAQAYAFSGGLFWNVDPDRSLPVSRKGLTILQQLAEEYPEEPRYGIELDDARVGHGAILTILKRHDAAEHLFDQAAESSLRRLQDHDDEFSIHKFARAKACQAWVHREMGHCEKALRELTECYEMFQPIMPYFKRRTRARIDYATLLLALGETHRVMGRLQEGEAFLREAIEKGNDIIADFPTSSWTHNRICEAYIFLADTIAAQGRVDEAISTYHSAYRLLQYSDDSKRLHGDQLIRLSHHLGELLWWEGRRTEATVYFQDALAVPGKQGQPIQTLILADCPDVSLRRPLDAVALAHRNLRPQDPKSWLILGIAQFRAGDWHGARDSLKKAQQLYHHTDAENLLFLAMAYHQLGDNKKACELYRLATAEPTAPIDWSISCLHGRRAALLAEAKSLLFN